MDLNGSVLLLLAEDAASGDRVEENIVLRFKIQIDVDWRWICELWTGAL